MGANFFFPGQLRTALPAMVIRKNAMATSKYYEDARRAKTLRSNPCEGSLIIGEKAGELARFSEALVATP